MDFVAAYHMLLFWLVFWQQALNSLIQLVRSSKRINAQMLFDIWAFAFISIFHLMVEGCLTSLYTKDFGKWLESFGFSVIIILVIR